ncbi:MAG: type II toxin-antitoxin system VapC family toxin [Acetobacteraceae bacterium]|nr:type II toxin-antitoxin system VapC family toxin [Acetobacteraceae bacterium]
MIVDSSVLLAILLREDDAPRYVDALSGRQDSRLSAATLVEASMVAEGRAGRAAGVELERLVAEAEIEIVPFTAEHAALAREGWRRYGKGRHPAGLNLGDCFAYALAKARSEPLLYKGDDFARTDVKAAIE